MSKTQSDGAEDAYYDRNQAAMAFAVLARALGHRVGLKANPEDPEWPILFVDLPTGQVSWHLPIDEVVIDEWEVYPGAWDGHDLAEKRRRMENFVRYYYPCGECRPL